MTTDPGTRRLLPQNPQMQAYSFAPPNFGPRENQRNYVFVDEHNRHKRLKVMRACEGCRRRKIKCDAATTNTWPCSACIRLKLQCVPPTVSYDRDSTQPGQSFSQGADEYDVEDDSSEDHFAQNLHVNLEGAKDLTDGLPQEHAYGMFGAYPPPYDSHVLDQHHIPVSHPFSSMNEVPLAASEISHQSEPNFSAASVHSSAPTHPASPESWHSDQGSPASLSDVLGALKIDETGAPPYMAPAKKSVVDAPVVEENEELLPPISQGPVRIPPDLMPSRDHALIYFDRYFSDVHPYVPVINKDEFYNQWTSDKESISPLLLESIFCCASQVMGDMSLSEKYLALAGKHADYFMDNPRLSTLQATFILLKARECAPKRGYYYRSWMTVVNMIAMAKDLGLHEHYDQHQTDAACDSTPMDCIAKTRMWQVLFVCELMIGAPQGRSDMSINPDTVDFSIPRQIPGQDEEECITSRNFVFFARIIRNVRMLNDVYGRIKRKKDWKGDPQVVALNPSFNVWPRELAPDLQISFPPDGSAPYLPSHFVGNLHTYYYLSIIMLHRPQLGNATDYDAVDGSWREHMELCYDSAKRLCRLQEAILYAFGLPGLMCMQRGLGFAIYCVLSCLELHLVAVTNPYAEFHTDARDFFTRHMRILEQCAEQWSVSGMSDSIQALREAFSADVKQPFVLKRTLTGASPPAFHRSPPRTSHFTQLSDRHSPAEVPHPVEHRLHQMSSPASAPGLDHKIANDPSGMESMLSMTGSHAHQAQQPMVSSVQMGGQSAWNPTKIFDQWNNAFGNPQTNVSPPAHLNYSSSPLQAMPPIPNRMQQTGYPGMAPGPNPTNHYNMAPPAPTFVTPNMWRESVAAVYEDGLKRRWDHGEQELIDQLSKRAR
ncbi:MAG: hypothetical protein M4579_001889 [Chaenotheca gracillima]|nr:MAG: hypothetical protein M4579_001889 [Chaenotheca gracillima]